jgi:hypothetical protein
VEEASQVEIIEVTLGAAINLLVLLVITLFLLGLASKAVRWLWEIWGGHR